MSEVFSRRINIYVDSGNAVATYDKLIAAKEKLINKSHDLKKREAELQKQIGDEIKLREKLIQNGYKKEAAALKEVTDKKVKALSDTQAALSKNASALQRATDQAERQARKVKGELAPSLKELTATYSKLTQEISRMSRQDPGFETKRQQWLEAGKAVQDYKSKLTTVKATISDMLKQAPGIAMGVMVGNWVTAAMSGVQQFIGGRISGNLNLSDELANIEKTTGLDPLQVRELNRELGRIDTRTATSELRQLAVEAGKLGKSSVADVRAFVEQGNQIKVALGEDLGGEAVISISKISKAFNEGMLNIASGINEIGQSSEASERYTVDFLNRMVGTASTVKLAASEVMGFSAALEINGQNIEASATALNQFFIDFVKNSSKFEKAAGLTNGSLKNMIAEKGVNEAFVTFLRNLKNSSESSDELLRKLEELGIDGARGAATFLTLANNIDLVAEQQRIASKAIADGTSITAEYEKRNNNLAGSFEKLGKWMRKALGFEEMGTAFENGIAALAKLTEVTNKHEQAIIKETESLIQLEMKLTDANTSQEERVKIIQQLQEGYPGFLNNIKAEEATTDQLTEAFKRLNEQMINRMVIAKQQDLIDAKQKQAADAKYKALQLEKELREKIAQVAREKGIDIGQFATKETTNEFGETVRVARTFNEQAQAFISYLTTNFDYTRRTTRMLSDDIGDLEIIFGELSQAQQDVNYNTTLSNTLTKERNKLMKELGVNLDTVVKKEDKVSGGVVSADPVITEDQKKSQSDLASFITKLRQEVYLNGLEKNFAELEALRFKYDEMRKQAEGNAEALKLIDERYEQEYQETLEKQYDDIVEHLGKVKELPSVLEIVGGATEATPNMPGQRGLSADRVNALQNLANDAQNYASMAGQAVQAFMAMWDNAEAARQQKDKAHFAWRLRALDSDLKRGLITQKQYDREVANINARQESAEREAQKRAFIRAKLLQVAMLTVQAVTASLSAYASQLVPGDPTSIIRAKIAAGVTAGLYGLNIIAAASVPPPQFEAGIEKWREGVDGVPHSHPSGGNPVLDPRTGATIATIEKNEAIIPADSAAANIPFIRWMLRNRGRSLATSGIINTIQSYGKGGMFATGSQGFGVNTAVSGDSNAFGLLVGEVKALRMDMQNLRVKFVQQEYERFTTQNTVGYSRSSFSRQ